MKFTAGDDQVLLQGEDVIAGRADGSRWRRPLWNDVEYLVFEETLIAAWRVVLEIGFLYADYLWKVGWLEKLKVEVSWIEAVDIPLVDIQGGMYCFGDYVDDPGSAKTSSSSERSASSFH